MAGKDKKVTQSAIARKAGISQAAVSSILSGSTNLNVSEETQARVLELAESLGYVKRRGEARTVSAKEDLRHVIIVESEVASKKTNQPWVEAAYQTFMGRLFTSSSLYLQETGGTLSVFHLGERQRLTEWLVDSGVDGVLWHAGDSDSALLYWVATRFPLVLLNRDWRSSALFDSVSVDQEKNVLLPAEHLWESGHRRIAYFGHTEGSIFRRRLAAYRQFVGEKGIRNYTEFQEISDSVEIPAIVKVQAIIETWKRLGKEAPTAFITSDVFALLLLAEARREGISVPGDLSVIGIDNTVACDLVEPSLTSMEAPLEEMCRVAVDLLARRKSQPGAPSQTVAIAPQLKVRGSACSLSSQKRGDFSGVKSVNQTAH